jgi:hypothetical protein
MIAKAAHPGELRTPRIHELELLFGFQAGHTVPAVRSGALKTSASTVSRKMLISRGLQVELILPAVRLGLSFLLPDVSTEAGELTGVSRGWTPEQQLVVEHLRGVDHRGSDVRLDAGTLMSPSAWPRRSLRPELWRWQTKYFWGWRDKNSDHINILEAYACLSAFRWRLRSRKGLAKKFLHLIDSQVVQAVFTKHRSSSKKLNRLCQKWSALELASSCHCLLGFVRSDQNPADAPSRHGDTPG